MKNWRLIEGSRFRTLRNFARRLRDFWCWDENRRHSWSQEGEDCVLERIFERQRDGFYVDVGAHHPTRFSNTYLFYRKGWSGINIDAKPGSMKAFQDVRPRDTNIEAGVHERSGTLDYYIFNEPALNGFSGELSAERHRAASPYRITQVIPVSVEPLHTLLSQANCPREIDFLTVDTEGLDLAVLKSNNWDSYRPKVVLVEVLESSIETLGGTSISQFLSLRGYRVYAKLFNTAIFLSEEFESSRLGTAGSGH